jgi:hypothetical protein
MKIIEYWQNMLRPHPTLNINFPARDSYGGIQERSMLTSAEAELTFPMRRRFDANYRRPQMGYMTEKLHRALSIAVFHFAVGGAHAAQRLYPALDALRHPCSLPLAQSPQ